MYHFLDLCTVNNSCMYILIHCYEKYNLEHMIPISTDA